MNKKKKKQGFSLRARLLIMVVCILVFALLLNLFLNFSKYEKSYSQMVRSRFGVITADLKHTLEYQLNLGLNLEELKNTQAVIREIKRKQPDIISITIFDDRGTILYDTAETRVNKPVPPQWAGALETGRQKLKIEPAAPNTLIDVSPLNNPFNVREGVVVLSFSAQHISAPAGEMLLYLVRYFLFFLLIFALTGYFFISWLLRGVVAGVNHMGKLLAQESQQDIPDDKSNIFGDLPESVRRFKKNSGRAMASIRRAEQELERLEGTK